MRIYLFAGVMILFALSGTYFQNKAIRLFGDLKGKYGHKLWYQEIKYVIRDTDDEILRNELIKLRTQMRLCYLLITISVFIILFV